MDITKLAEELAMELPYFATGSKDAHAQYVRIFERILLSRLGASGKEEEATLLRSPEGHVVARLGASGKAGWTKEPKEAGWYWLRYDGLQAVHVYQDGHRAYPDGRPVLISSRGTVATLCRNGAEWLPIPVPEE